MNTRDTADSCCRYCDANWTEDSTAHLGVDVVRLRDGTRKAILMACCATAREFVLLFGYRTVYGQPLATTLQEMGCDPTQVTTWENDWP